MAVDALARDGFALVSGVLDADGCAAALADLQDQTGSGPGSRDLLSLPWCQRLAVQLRGCAGLSGLIPHGHQAVQCTYFEKSLGTNWLVALHQDLAIPVQARVEHPALRGWSIKEEAQFVQPPPHVLEQLVALRLHLDDCGPDDGPLRVVPGSHAMGVIDSAQAAQIRDDRGEVACPAAQGAALVMRPLLLHASSKARGSSHRRVLHFLFGPAQLPYGLAWA
ncbi:phytanoyl-CoA dioxygenase family protein [Comamonas piscis]|uniref:Phytanoyl-CoA dioxygenase family protein n=1 Tax=Comamonas piscis TaxID=1562974 RepID=A0A7G5EC39_9BURK|nr:phytanoyl-CoA dioxygenase family protein [Comamonas piscis]QMV71564.1 phytanoyl-CoA dioxygenase family protein [Comamonas piscis]WSO34280.1 phytanoyl-CoA dioxygenase family protein [Comamonas piscis]